MDQEIVIIINIKWYAELEKHAPKTPKIFVGTKIDLQGGGGDSKMRMTTMVLSHDEVVENCYLSEIK